MTTKAAAKVGRGGEAGKAAKIVQSSFAKTTLFFIILSILAADCDGIKMKGLIAPKWVDIGESTKLLCDYDLGRDAMYSIKWFKDDVELYRYIPTNQPLQYRSFQSPGVIVNEKLSKPNMLTVRITGPLGSGEYKCEVTIETPSFVTLAEKASMTVMTPPLSTPTMEGVANFYNPGDLIDINCTSFESKPAAVLSWTVNGAPAQEGTYLPQKEFLNTTSGLESATSTLRFVAETLHFPNGRLQLTCVAKIEDLWSDRTTQVAYGAGEVGQPNQLLISNLAGCQKSSSMVYNTILVALFMLLFQLQDQ